MAKAAVNKTFTRTTATGDWNSRPEGEGILWSESDVESSGEITEATRLDTDGVYAGTITITAPLRIGNDFPTTSLTVGSLHVEDGGGIYVGSLSDLYDGRCVIELNGTPPTNPRENAGHDRSIMFHEGSEFIVHAVPQTPHVRVGASVEEGETTIPFRTPVTNWKAGDRVVGTYTGFYGVEVAHETTIVSVALDGLSMVIADEMPWDGYGELQYPTDGGNSGQNVSIGTGWSLDPEAEFTPPGEAEASEMLLVLDEAMVWANLTRPVTIQGANDTHWTTDGFGGHVMRMHNSVKLQLNGGVEFYRMGQKGHMGRYPLHDHMTAYDSETNGTQTIADVSTAQTLTIPGDTTLIFLYASPDADLWYTTNGSTPAVDSGTRVSAGRPSEPITSWTSVKVIQHSSGGNVKAFYNKGDGSHLGDTATGYGLVKYCVFRECSQRGLALHGSCGWDVQYNIFYKVHGQNIFLEDGSERRHTIKYNLSIGALPIASGTLSNGYPARLQKHEDFEFGAVGGIWVTNPDNTIEYNLCIGSYGIGIINAYPDAAMGLSKLTGLRPRFTRQLALNHNFCYGNGEGHGFESWAGMSIGRIVVSDSIADSNPLNVAYEPRDDDTPTGARVRITPSFNVLVKNRNGYFNTTDFPSYRGWINVDNYFAGFSGTTNPITGPEDDLTGSTRGLIDRCILGGQTLNIVGYPAEWVTYYSPRHSIAMATYHFTLLLKNSAVLNCPLVEDLPSGAVGWTDLYLTPTEGMWNVTGVRLINSDMGYRYLPPAITGDPAEPNFGWGRNMSHGLHDPYGYYGGGDKWHVFNATIFTYDAHGIQDPVIVSEDVGATNGKLVTGPVYGVLPGYLNNPDRITFPPPGPNQDYVTSAHTIFTRYNNSWVSQGTWEMEFAGTSRTWGVVKGNSHIHKFGLEFPDVGALTYFEFLINSLCTTGDSFIARLDFAEEPTSATLTPENFGDEEISLTAAADLAALEGGSGNQYWFDSGNEHLYVYVKGGIQVGLDYQTGYGDRDIVRPLILAVEAA